MTAAKVLKEVQRVPHHLLQLRKVTGGHFVLKRDHMAGGTVLKVSTQLGVWLFFLTLFYVKYLYVTYPHKRA